MGEFVYRPAGKKFGFTPEIMDAAHAESISLFDVAPGSVIEMDLSFDEDGGNNGKITIQVDESAQKEGLKRGSFTVLDAELSFESPIGELVGRTGSVDSAISYRPGYMPPFGLAKVAHITKGRDLIINFDIPDMPDSVNRWIPFVLDCRLLPPQTESEN